MMNKKYIIVGLFVKLFDIYSSSINTISNSSNIMSNTSIVTMSNTSINIVSDTLPDTPPLTPRIVGRIQLPKDTQEDNTKYVEIHKDLLGIDLMIDLTWELG